jgi:hypothetical protein
MTASATSAPTAPEPDPHGTAGASAVTERKSLLRAEARRLTSRRLVRWAVLLALVGFLLLSALLTTAYSRPTPELRAEAERQMQAVIAEQREFYEQCIAEPRPSGVTPEQACGPSPEEQGFRVEDFLTKQPFRLAEDLPNGAVAVGMATAALAFVVGATAIGAEWSTRSIVALLFWEPRRLRVLAVKATVVAVAAALLAATAQVLWLAVAEVLARLRGTTGGLPPGFWLDLLALQGRATLLVVLVALLGFSLSNLVRNTAAALGAGFVYFAVAETAVRVGRPDWTPWLLSDNAAALVLPGGHRLFLGGEATAGSSDAYSATAREVVLSNLHGGLVLGGVTAALLALGAVLFVRRDLH